MVAEICLPNQENSDESVDRAMVQARRRPVSVDEPLVEIETDNVTIEVTASATGVLSEILVRDGETVKTGAVLGKDYGVWW